MVTSSQSDPVDIEKQILDFPCSDSGQHGRSRCSEIEICRSGERGEQMSRPATNPMIVVLP
jgi:hypothetical protein